MRFFSIVFLLFMPLFAIKFEYENSKIYKLKNDEFSIKNGDLTIKKDALCKQSTEKQTLKTRYSQTTLTQNLNFYSHLKTPRNNHHLLRVRQGNNRYFSRIRKNVIFNESEIEAPTNCYILLQNAESKILHAKSSATLLNLEDLASVDSAAESSKKTTQNPALDSAKIVDSALDSAENPLDSALLKVYFGCDGRF